MSRVTVLHTAWIIHIVKIKLESIRIGGIVGLPSPPQYPGDPQRHLCEFAASTTQRIVLLLFIYKYKYSPNTLLAPVARPGPSELAQAAARRLWTEEAAEACWAQGGGEGVEQPGHPWAVGTHAQGTQRALGRPTAPISTHWSSRRLVPPRAASAAHFPLFLHTWITQHSTIPSRMEPRMATMPSMQ